MENVKFAHVGMHGASSPNIPPTVNNWRVFQAGECGRRKDACFFDKSSNL
jgi:hypothetical protein